MYVAQGRVFLVELLISLTSMINLAVKIERPQFVNKLSFTGTRFTDEPWGSMDAPLFFLTWILLLFSIEDISGKLFDFTQESRRLRFRRGVRD